MQRETGPVPLYLIPQALSGEIRQAGEALLEVNIRRTRGHHYLITLVSSSTEGESHA